MQKGEFKSYWSETASYEAIVPLINMDYDGLKTAIIEMLSGAAVKVNTANQENGVCTEWRNTTGIDDCSRKQSVEWDAGILERIRKFTGCYIEYGWRYSCKTAWKNSWWVCFNYSVSQWKFPEQCFNDCLPEYNAVLF